MFIYKKTEELEKLTPAELDTYKSELKAHEKTEMEKGINDAVSKEIKTATDTLKTFLGTELAAQIKDLDFGGNTVKSYEVQIGEFLEENKDRIKEIKNSGSGLLELQLKVVANVTTANGTNTTPPAITGTQQAPISNINYRGIDLAGLTTTFATDLAAYPYTEAKPKDGDYTFLSEGGTKLQIDFTWETNYAKPVKAAAWIRLTDESVQDVRGLQSVATDLLKKKHDLKKAKGILFGDGNAPNPKGATVYGRAFSAGALALAVKEPNFMDVVNAVVTDIATTHNFVDETPYMANLVMINPNDFYLQLVSAKDKNGLPLYPQASLFNRVVIGGITIIPEESIPAGDIFVADMSKYNVSDYVGYNVKIGWVNDDFIKNQFVILAESRFHAFVMKLDEQAFVYDQISDIKTAITFVEAQ